MAYTLLCCIALPLTNNATSVAMVDFERGVRPIIESACLSCHSGDNADGGLRLDSRKAATLPGERGPALVPRDPEKSPFYTRTILPADHEELMPPGEPLDASQTGRLRKWIEEGAPWPKETKLQVQPRINFAEHVQPILETSCLSCHSRANAEGSFDLSNRESAFDSGSSPPSIVPFDVAGSALYQLTALSRNDPALMPPQEQGGPLSEKEIETLRLWIAQGAIWPKEIALWPRTKKSGADASPDDLTLVERIHVQIVERAKTDGDGVFSDYTATLPKTGVPFHMVAIRGGEFRMGSPDHEPGRLENEGPQSMVQVNSFWLGKYEVTWDEFEPFMITAIERFKSGARKDFDPSIHNDVDAVSGPTAPYADMTFGMGRLGYPAVCMTQHAANKYCQWLSAQTGHFYRLPTEAEWEYACRAGTTSCYSFGNDPADLDQYAWHLDNSEEKSQKVGGKRPNHWGLHDMHGNVMEWTADQFLPDYFERLASPAINPFVRPQSLYPRSVRGGSWNDRPEQLRSAVRYGSDPYWQQQDPQLPKSIWYLTDAPWLGFRIARPRDVPSVEEMHFYWNSSTGKL